MGVKSIFSSKQKAGPQISAERTDFRQAVLDRTAPSRENTLRMMAELQAQAQGQGPSFGTEQLAKTNQRSLAQTLAAASAMRGPGAAATKRNLMSQSGAAQRNVAEQGAVIRAQEQLSAQDALSQLAEQQQAQDLQQVMQPGGLVASTEAKRYEEAIKAANKQAESKGKEGGALLGLIGTVAGTALGAAFGGPAGAAMGGAAGGAIGTGIGTAAGEQVSDEQQKSEVGGAKKDIKAFLDAISAKTGPGQLSNQDMTNITSRIGPGALAKADFRHQTVGNKEPALKEIASMLQNNPGPGQLSKHDMARLTAAMGPGVLSEAELGHGSAKSPKADSVLKSFLDSIQAKKYKYKRPELPGAAPGQRFGILAQDLEKSEMGKSLVKETPMGKVVDTVQGFGALLAAQAEMHKRLKSLEKKKKD